MTPPPSLRDRLRGLGRGVRPSVDEARLLIGSGRSGTTWLLQELVRLGGATPVFEPFHPIEVERSGALVPRGFLPAGAPAPGLEEHVRDVLSGRFSAPWTEQMEQPAHATGPRAVKEIHSHLWAGWLHERFPTVPIAVVVRHPFAQVGSRSALAWSDGKLDRIAGDEALRDAHVPGLETLVREAGSPLERGVLLWAIDNRVLLRTIESADPFVFGYEQAVAEPAVLGDLLEHFGCDRPAADALRDEARTKASLMSQPGASTVASGDANAKWLATTEPGERKRALAILDRLGFAGVFDESGGVDIEALRTRAAAGLD